MKPQELPFVRDMFDRIAPYYDFLNRLLSLRQDVYWRRVLVDNLSVRSGGVLLDVACGTGDVALEIARRRVPHITSIGVDFAPQMLRRALPKIKGTRVRLAAADAFHLPFPAASFDAITIAFGIRNIQDKPTALQQFYRHLKPGGTLAILELVTPEKSAIRRAYLFYFNRLLPLLGRFFSKHHYAYSYLPTSVAQFPPSAQFCADMRAAGFKGVRYRTLTMGIAALFVGQKG